MFDTLKASIDAHLTVVMSAMAVGRWLESVTGRSLKKIVQQLRSYREMRINVDGDEAVAAVPLPPELSELMNQIKRRGPGTAH